MRGSCLFCRQRSKVQPVATVRICSMCLSGLKHKVYLLLESRTFEETRELLGFPQDFFESLLQRLGIYNEAWIRENIGSVKNLTTFKLAGFRDEYSNPEKDKDRAYIVESAKEFLGEVPVSILTLPYWTLTCYVEASEALSVDPSSSLLVERDKFVFNLLCSWVKNWGAFTDGEMLDGVGLYHGNLSQALTMWSGCFNLVNFDFNGPWTEEVVRAVSNLFNLQRLQERAFFSLTLAESTRWVQNPNYPLVEDYHRNFVVEEVKKIAAESGYKATYCWHHRYKQDSRYPMITITFKVTKKASKN